MHFTIIDTRADILIYVDNIEIVAHAWTDRQKSVKFHNKINTNKRLTVFVFLTG